jgi:hypothetical protein
VRESQVRERERKKERESASSVIKMDVGYRRDIYARE